MATVAELFRAPRVSDLAVPPFGPIDEGRVERILVEEHGFSADRIRSAVRRARARPARIPTVVPAPPGRQTTLMDAFGGPSA
jgi:hypothetical protein